MGYTHYYSIKKGTPKLSKDCLEDIKKVIKKYSDIIQYEEDDKRKPVVTENLIRFNGIKREGHETFLFETPPKSDDFHNFDEEGFMFRFCKTERKPYDIVVCEVLLILKAHLGDNLSLNSDGFSNHELSFDGNWNQAIEEVKDMGYKINAGVYSRDEGESPYYDCEIFALFKNVKKKV